MTFDMVVLGALVVLLVAAVACLIFAMAMGAWVIWKDRP